MTKSLLPYSENVSKIIVSELLIYFYSIIERNGGRAPLTYHQFQTVVAGMDSPPLPDPPVTAATIGDAISPISDNHDEKYGVPTLEELGQ